jgi:hypothetical protein
MRFFEGVDMKFYIAGSDAPRNPEATMTLPFCEWILIFLLHLSGIDWRHY